MTKTPQLSTKTHKHTYTHRDYVKHVNRDPQGASVPVLALRDSWNVFCVSSHVRILCAVTHLCEHYSALSTCVFSKAPDLFYLQSEFLLVLSEDRALFPVLFL